MTYEMHAFHFELAIAVANRLVRFLNAGDCFPLPILQNFEGGRGKGDCFPLPILQNCPKRFFWEGHILALTRIMKLELPIIVEK